jgi:hypothetical protein
LVIPSFEIEGNKAKRQRGSAGISLYSQALVQSDGVLARARTSECSSRDEFVNLAATVGQNARAPANEYLIHPAASRTLVTCYDMLRRLGRMFARVIAGIRFMLGNKGKAPWTTPFTR